MVLLARRDVLDVDDVTEHVQQATGQPGKARGHYELAGRPLAEVERDLIQATLKLTEGNRQKAAKLMGIGERTLYRKLHEYGLT
jgi:two-component system response regulator HydG